MKDIKKQIALVGVTGASLIVSAMGWAKAASIPGQFELRYRDYGKVSLRTVINKDQNWVRPETFTSETESGRQALAKIALSDRCLGKLTVGLEKLRHDAKFQETVSKVAAIANASSWKVIGDETTSNSVLNYTWSEGVGFNTFIYSIVRLKLVLYDAQGRNVTKRLGDYTFAFGSKLPGKKTKEDWPRIIIGNADWPRIIEGSTCYDINPSDIIANLNAPINSYYYEQKQLQAEARRKAEEARRKAAFERKVARSFEQVFGSPNVGETGPARRSPAVASGQSIKSSLPDASADASGGRAINKVGTVNEVTRQM